MANEISFDSLFNINLRPNLHLMFKTTESKQMNIFARLLVDNK